MAMQRVTIELPEPVFQQLVRIAEATSQPLEVLAAQSIVSNLPPSADNAPPEIQAELLRMQTLSVDELLKIAEAQVAPEEQARHAALLEKNQMDEISPEERQELSELRSVC
jgi:predicted transcriptional regulator